MTVSQQCSFMHCCFCLDEDDRLKIMGDYFAEKEAKRLAASTSSRKKNRTKEEYLRMMVFMVRSSRKFTPYDSSSWDPRKQGNFGQRGHVRALRPTGYVLQSYLFAMFT
jgi:hypothetical protein